MNNQFNLPSFYAIVLAAGQGSRVQNTTGIKKQFMPYRHAPLWWQSVKTFSLCPAIKGIVLVFPNDDYDTACEDAKNRDSLVPLYFAKGGTKRQGSVYQGLQALPSTCTHVLIHDSARPFFSPNLVHQLIQSFSNSHDIADITAVIPAVPITDTIKEIDNTGKIVTKSLQRDTLRAIQTPQAFRLKELLHAHEYAHNIAKTTDATNITDTADITNATDDAMLMEALSYPVHVIMGEKNNYKITHVEDLTLLIEQSPPIFYTGYGYDVHRFGGNRPFMLGGICIPSPLKITAHSDGDVLLHALMDAMLSCLCMGDIGTLFPDTDPRYENISSSLLLTHVLDLWNKQNLTLCHVDLTIITQKPKIAPFSKQIRNNIARLLGIPPEHINLKATTEEGLGFTGAGLGIKTVALVNAMKIV